MFTRRPIVSKPIAAQYARSSDWLPRARENVNDPSHQCENCVTEWKLINRCIQGAWCILLRSRPKGGLRRLSLRALQFLLIHFNTACGAAIGNRLLSKGLITWRISARVEISTRLSKNQTGDYMEKDSVQATSLTRAKKSEKIPCNRNGISAQAEFRRVIATKLFQTPPPPLPPFLAGLKFRPG